MQELAVRCLSLCRWIMSVDTGISHLHMIGPRWPCVRAWVWSLGMIGNTCALRAGLFGQVRYVLAVHLVARKVAHTAITHTCDIQMSDAQSAFECMCCTLRIHGGYITGKRPPLLKLT